MSSFIYNDRFYSLNSNVNSPSSAMGFKPKFVSVPMGLLMYNSPENLKHFNDFPIAQNNNGHMHTGMQNMYQGLNFQTPRPVVSGLESSFFVFTAIGQRVSMYRPSFPGSKVVTYTRQQLKDVGLVSIISNLSLQTFLEICLQEPDLGVSKFYQGVAKNYLAGAFRGEFMANSEGIPLDELFAHPHASAVPVHHNQNRDTDFDPCNMTTFGDSLLKGTYGGPHGPGGMPSMGGPFMPPQPMNGFMMPPHGSGLNNMSGGYPNPSNMIGDLPPNMNSFGMSPPNNLGVMQQQLHTMQQMNPIGSQYFNGNTPRHYQPNSDTTQAPSGVESESKPSEDCSDKVETVNNLEPQTKGNPIIAKDKDLNPGEMFGTVSDISLYKSTPKEHIYIVTLKYKGGIITFKTTTKGVDCLRAGNMVILNNDLTGYSYQVIGEDKRRHG